MDQRPLVSILIPTYGRAELLRLALESVLAQTYENIDVYVSDDCSPDHTSDVLREFAERDSRVRYDRNERNLGNFGNGRKLFPMARGEYLKVLLDDDLLAPDHVETLLAPMLADPSITLSFSKRTLIDGDGVAQGDFPHTAALSSETAVIDGRSIAELCLRTMTNWIGEQTTVLYPRRAISPTTMFRFGGLEISHALADLGLWLNLLGKGKAWYTPIPKSSFRIHEGQIGAGADAIVASRTDFVEFAVRAYLYGYLDEEESILQALNNAMTLTIQLLLPNTVIDQDAPNMAVLPALATRIAAEIAAVRQRRDGLHVASTPPGVVVGVPVIDPGADELRPPIPRDRVSVVLVAGDDLEAVQRQVESLAEVSPGDAFDVVVVDDDASDVVREFLGLLGGDVQVVRHEGAGGVPAAWRTGAAHAASRFVAFARPGVTFRRGWLATLVNLLADASVGVTSLGVIDGVGQEPTHLGFELDADGELVARPLDREPTDWSLFDAVPVAAPPQGLVLVTRVVLDAAIASEHDIDEVQLAARARELGLTTWIDPSVVVGVGEPVGVS